MNRMKLKRGGCRKKAIWGEAITAAATLAAAGIQAAATASAAKTQSKAMLDNAKAQADAMQRQNANNNELQKQNIEFTRAQNQENRQQQQDIQMTLQTLAGQQNMNERLRQQKVVAKCGHRTRLSQGGMQQPFYGGAQPFEITDGGGALPIAVDGSGYGLYELYGHDHDHYHKTRGKYKSGVGVKFANGEVVEGEGNQNSNNGELLYVTPEDAIFLSKHSIGGFNPAKAVKQGMQPEEAYIMQEYAKAANGIKDDGNKALYGGYNTLLNAANITQNYPNVTAPVASGVAYLVNRDRTTSPVARNGARVKLKCGGKRRRKAYYGDAFWEYRKSIYGNPSKSTTTPSTTSSVGGPSHWNNFGGAYISGAGNLIGGALSAGANIWAGNMLNKAYNQAGHILSDAYGKLSTVDMDILDDDTFDSGVGMAVVRDPGYRNTAMRERLRRNAQAEIRDINNNTISSAARQLRRAAINDRYGQRISELAEQERNTNEQIAQGNAERITTVSGENANRRVQMRQNLTNARLSLAQYNNDIENMKITGAAQARADALTQGMSAKTTGWTSAANSVGNAFTNVGQGFASAFDAMNTNRTNQSNTFAGVDDGNLVRYLVTNPNMQGNRIEAAKLKQIYENRLRTLRANDPARATYEMYINDLNTIL